MLTRENKVGRAVGRQVIDSETSGAQCNGGRDLSGHILSKNLLINLVKAVRSVTR